MVLWHKLCLKYTFTNRIILFSQIWRANFQKSKICTNIILTQVSVILKWYYFDSCFLMFWFFAVKIVSVLYTFDIPIHMKCLFDIFYIWLQSLSLFCANIINHLILRRLWFVCSEIVLSTSLCTDWFVKSLKWSIEHKVTARSLAMVHVPLADIRDEIKFAVPHKLNRYQSKIYTFRFQKK